MKAILTLVVIVGVLFALMGCTPSEPAISEPAQPATDPAAGTSPAPPTEFAYGVTDLADGKITASGWLTYVDLEGGFYVLQEGPPSDTPDVEIQVPTVIVIANSHEFAEELAALAGGYVVATGTRLDGASVRMAGPEMMVESIEAAR